MPRKGYRFVAPVEPVQPGGAPNETTQPSLLPTLVIAGALVVVALVLTIGLLNRAPEPEAVERFRSVAALTREGGLEFLPAVSPDNRYLMYSTEVDNRLDLILKDLDTGTTRLISDQLGSAGLRRRLDRELRGQDVGAVLVLGLQRHVDDALRGRRDDDGEALLL